MAALPLRESLCPKEALICNRKYTGPHMTDSGVHKTILGTQRNSEGIFEMAITAEKSFTLTSGHIMCQI